MEAEHGTSCVSVQVPSQPLTQDMKGSLNCFAGTNTDGKRLQTLTGHTHPQDITVGPGPRAESPLERHFGAIKKGEGVCVGLWVLRLTLGLAPTLGTYIW